MSARGSPDANTRTSRNKELASASSDATLAVRVAANPSSDVSKLEMTDIRAATGDR
jgi:hypothetical protein